MAEETPASNSGSEETSRRQLLKGIGAAGAAAVFEANTVLKNIGKRGDDDATSNRDHVEGRKTQERVDLSWMTKEHIEDLLGMLYHGHNIGATLAHATDPWKRDEYKHGILYKAPWGGRCTIVYNTHGKEHDVGNLKADVFTVEEVEVGWSISDLEQNGTIVPVNELNFAEKNMYCPSYVVDIGTSRGQERILKNALRAELVGAIAGGAVLLSTALSPDMAARPATIALGTYLLSSYLAIFAHVSGNVIGGESSHKADAIAKAMNDIPNAAGLLMFKLRNVLASEKNHCIASALSEKKGVPVHLVTNWGALHVGLETETLRSSEERIATLRRWRPLIFLLIANPKDRSFLWTCPRFTYEKRGDGTLVRRFTPPHIEVPSLKALFSDERQP